MNRCTFIVIAVYACGVAAQDTPCVQTGIVLESLDEKIAAFRKSHADYIDFVVEETQGSSNASRSNIWADGTVAVDDGLRALILATAARERDFVALKDRLEGIANWQEIPASISVYRLPAKQRMPAAMNLEPHDALPSDARPTILYKSAPLEGGGSISVLHHTYWSAEGRRFSRIVVEPYALIISNEGISAHRLFEDHPYGLRYFTEYAYVTVDLIHAGERIPWILEVEGPAGNGGFVYFTSLRYNEATESLVGVARKEWGDAEGWSYDGTTRTLHVAGGEPEPNTISVSEKLPAWKAQAENEDRHRKALSSITGAQDAAITEAIDGLKQSYASYIERLGSLPEGLQSSSVDKGAMEFDIRLRSTVEELLSIFHSIDAVRNRLANVVDWEEIPDRVNARDGIAEMLTTGDSKPEIDSLKPAIYYKCARSTWNVEVVACQNALVVKQAGTLYRMRFVPYAVTQLDGRVSMNVLDPFPADSNVAPWVSENVWSLVDVFDTHDRVPPILVIQGPNGNGGYVHLNLATSVNVTRGWSTHRFGEYDGVGGWFYDGDSCILTLATEANDPVTWRVDIRKVGPSLKP